MPGDARCRNVFHWGARHPRTSSLPIRGVVCCRSLCILCLLAGNCLGAFFKLPHVVAKGFHQIVRELPVAAMRNTANRGWSGLA